MQIIIALIRQGTTDVTGFSTVEQFVAQRFRARNPVIDNLRDGIMTFVKKIMFCDKRKTMVERAPMNCEVEQIIRYIKPLGVK